MKMKMMSTTEGAESFSADGRGRGKCAWMPAGAQIGCLVDLREVQAHWIPPTETIGLSWALDRRILIILAPESGTLQLKGKSTLWLVSYFGIRSLASVGCSLAGLAIGLSGHT